MKQNETIFKAKNKPVAVMILCFLYAGFAFITISFLFYNSIVTPNFTPDTFFQKGFKDVNAFSGDDFNQNLLGSKKLSKANGFNLFNPVRFVSSPSLLIFLISGSIALLAGITIWGTVREKEIRSIKRETSNNLLLPDEKALTEALKKSNYELTQAKLVKETGLSKVQVHRAIKRLEAKGVLEKHGYGLTNKIILKREFFE